MTGEDIFGYVFLGPLAVMVVVSVVGIVYTLLEMAVKWLGRRLFVALFALLLMGALAGRTTWAQGTIPPGTIPPEGGTIPPATDTPTVTPTTGGMEPTPTSVKVTITIVPPSETPTKPVEATETPQSTNTPTVPVSTPTALPTGSTPVPTGTREAGAVEFWFFPMILSSGG